MKKNIIALFALMLAGLMLTGCGSKNYADGTYTAQSSVFTADSLGEDEEGGDGYGEVTITIKDNVIVDCRFDTYEVDGTLKGEDYGKQNGEIANKDYYNKAQKAVAGSKNYAEQLTEKGNLKDVDSVSGATISYGQFKEAVSEALKQAQN